ncbi:unnamed protein product [Malus baccata var. baccata]
MESTDQAGDPSSSRKRKYKEEVGSIHWKDLKVAMQPSIFKYVNNYLAKRRSIVDELGEHLDENESDHDWMMRLSSYVMTEYDDRLREVERYKAKFKENKQLVNDARKMSKALADAICLKDQNFESLKRWNGENESKDGPRDAEEGSDGDGVETQSDIVRGSALDEDDL